MSELKKPNIIYLGLFLGIIGSLAAGMLAGFDYMTKGPRKEAQMKTTSNALKEVLPSFDEIKPIYDEENAKKEELKKFIAADKTTVVYYRAIKDNKIVGIAGVGFSKKGYAGKVTVMVGLALDGKVTKVIVTEQKETPGLGTVVTDRKREKTIFDLFGGGKEETGLPKNNILDQFDGHIAKTGSPWKVVKDGGQFDFITGATITSRAVTDAVYAVDSTFVANKDEILSLPSDNKKLSKK